MTPSIRRLIFAFMVMVTSESVASGQLIIGHRGASRDAPENTLAAFTLAIEQGADGFEGDFYLGADGQILCHHDRDTKRITGKKLSVTKTPFDQLRALDVGSWKNPKFRNERIPTFAECLAVVPPGDAKFFVELKSGPEIAAPLAKAIAASSLPPQQFVIISFHEEAVAACKKQMPHIKAQWLWSLPRNLQKRKKPRTPEEVAATLKRIQADSLGAEASVKHFNAAYIKRLRELGVEEFGVWTVDDPKVAKYYADLGAWSITTNRPGSLRAQLKHD